VPCTAPQPRSLHLVLLAAHTWISSPWISFDPRHSSHPIVHKRRSSLLVPALIPSLLSLQVTLSLWLSLGQTVAVQHLLLYFSTRKQRTKSSPYLLFLLGQFSENRKKTRNFDSRKLSQEKLRLSRTKKRKCLYWSIISTLKILRQSE
jgi:hypothetical protein